MRLYEKEFPGFGPLPFEPGDYGLQDISWGNDICPSFGVLSDDPHEVPERLWIDWADPARREMGPKAPRFIYQKWSVDCQYHVPVIETSNVDAIREFLRIMQIAREERR